MPDILDVVGAIVSIIVFIIIVIAIVRTGGILDDVRKNLIDSSSFSAKQLYNLMEIISF